MKKLWIVLLSVALIAAFAMPVGATDVKFSGSYIIQGYYENNRALTDGGASLMNTWQRLRMQADFKVQEGLSLTVGADAMDKIWGASRTTTPYATTYTSTGVTVWGSGEAQNIHMNLMYVTANLWGGLLRVGYQHQSQFGTLFGDGGDYTYGPRVRYDYTVGPWTFIAVWDKQEGTEYYSSTGPAGNIGNSLYQVDQEGDAYIGVLLYKWGKGEAGALYKYFDDSGAAGTNPNPATDTGYKRQWDIIDAYFKNQWGPLYTEGEAIYMWGKTKNYETPGNGIDQTKDALSLYLSATYDFAPMYGGLTLVYVPGNDYNRPDRDESGWPGNIDFNPCLILWNFDLARWNGGMGPYTGATNNMSGGITNAEFAQIFAGVKPLPKLDIKAAYATATADKDGAATGWVSKNYGSEFDLTATYKIYDNLSYMVGFGYLWAGDYFKGTNPAAVIDNDYLFTQKMILTF